MKLIDTHTHLYSDEFLDDREAMIRRAINAGVTRFFVPAIDSSHFQAMLETEALFPENVHLMMGLHPVYVGDNYKEELEFVERELQRRKYFAVGEIGIDLYWRQDNLEAQKTAFAKQIELAHEHDLPINIHCRDAFDEIFEVLERYRGNVRGIFHCFTGNEQQAQQAVSLDMKLGIGGVVTFKNGGIDKFISRIGLENLVLETDSPYLAPVPYRGKRNESSFIIRPAEKLAEIFGKPLSDIAEITSRNAASVFGI